MIIIFRVDSSNIIGGGHLTRCINIANQLKKRKVNSIFLCQDLPGLDIKLLKIHNLKYKLLPENKDFKKDAKETIKFLIEESLNPDCLVIDHYEIDIKWEKKVKQYTKKLLIIDDLANKKHFCDVLINQVFGVKSSSYKNLINDSCKLFLGSEYIMLRPEFQKVRKNLINKVKPFEVKDIHLFFSSNDKNGLTIKYSNLLLDNFPGINLHISVGNNFIQLNELRLLGLKNKRINWEQNNLNIEKQMAKCQIAIGTPGMITWERACLGIPSIQLGIKDFQNEILDDLDSLGICKWIGLEKEIDEEKFIDICRNFFKNNELLLQMKNKCFAAIDCKGMERVVKIIMQEY